MLVVATPPVQDRYLFRAPGQYQSQQIWAEAQQTWLQWTCGGTCGERCGNAGLSTGSWSGGSPYGNLQCLLPATFSYKLEGPVGVAFGRLTVRPATWLGYGTICATGFDVAKAKVACRSLGLPSTSPIVTANPGGTGTVYFMNYDCVGDETALHNCPTWLTANWACTHANDIGVDCDPEAPWVLSVEPLRQQCTGQRVAGALLKIRRGAVSAYVCTTGLSGEFADSVCAANGFPGSTGATIISAAAANAAGRFGFVNGAVIGDPAGCVGNLSTCNATFTASCTANDAAYVVCSAPMNCSLTGTPTLTPTATPSRTVSVPPTPTHTPSSTATPSVTWTPSATRTVTAATVSKTGATPTVSRTPSASSSPSGRTASATRTATLPPTPTSTRSASRSASLSPSLSPSGRTATRSASRGTPTATPSVSKGTLSPTASRSPLTRTGTATRSTSVTLPPTPTRTATPSRRTRSPTVSGGTLTGSRTAATPSASATASRRTRTTPTTRTATPSQTLAPTRTRTVTLSLSVALTQTASIAATGSAGATATETLPIPVPEPEVKTIIPPAALRAIESTTVSVTAPASVISMSPATAIQASRNSALLQAQYCNQRIDVPPGRADSPTQMTVIADDADYELRYQTGQAVMNTIVFGGAALLQVAVAGIHYHLVGRHMTPTTALETVKTGYVPPMEPEAVGTFRGSLTWARFPSMLVFPGLFLLQPTTTAIATIFLRGATGKTMGAVALAEIFVLGGVFVLAYVAIVRAPKQSMYRLDQFDEDEATSATKPRLLIAFDWLFAGTGQWCDPQSAKTTGWTRRYAGLFTDYRGRFHWFLVVEAVVCIFLGLCLALLPYVHCRTINIVILVFFLGYAALVFVLRPLEARFDIGMSSTGT